MLYDHRTGTSEAYGPVGNLRYVCTPPLEYSIAARIAHILTMTIKMVNMS